MNKVYLYVHYSRLNMEEQIQMQGVDNSLARPGRKQARKHVRDASDFNNIETRVVIKFLYFFSPLQCAERNSRNSDRNIRLFPSW